mgnify:CR=1 FL=1
MLKMNDFLNVYLEVINDLNNKLITIDNNDYNVNTDLFIPDKNIACVLLSKERNLLSSFNVKIDDCEMKENNEGYVESFKFSLFINSGVYKYNVKSLDELYESVLTCLVNYIKHIDFEKLTINKTRLFKQLGLKRF